MPDYPPVGGAWRAANGTLYRVTGHAVIEATDTPAVLYQRQSTFYPALTAGIQWCRPLAEFLDGRFTREDDADVR